MKYRNKEDIFVINSFILIIFLGYLVIKSHKIMHISLNYYQPKNTNFNPHSQLYLIYISYNVVVDGWGLS